MPVQSGGAVRALQAVLQRASPVVMAMVLVAHVVLGASRYPVPARALASVPGIVLVHFIARYFRRLHQGELPFLPLAALQYYVAFGFPVFFSLRFEDLNGPIEFSDDAHVTATLAVALGSVAFAVGGSAAYAWSGPLAKHIRRVLPPAELPASFQKVALRYAALCVMVSVALAWRPGVLPSSIAHPVYLATTIPVAIGVVCGAGTAGAAARSARRALPWLFFGALFASLVTSLLEYVVRAGIAWVGGAVAVWRRFSVRLVVIMLVGFAVLNPLKHEYRRAAWRDDVGSLGMQDRANLWRDAAANVGSKDDETAEAHGTVARLSELGAVTHAIELVPHAVDYAYGADWIHIFTSVVPRALWPDKPTTAETMQRYGVAFGRQTEEGATRTAFLNPLVVDGYWNFGWLGVFLACATVGALAGAATQVLAAPHWAAVMLGVAWLGMSSSQGCLVMVLSGLPQEIGAHLGLAWALYFVARRLDRPLRRGAPTGALS